MRSNARDRSEVRATARYSEIAADLRQAIDAGTYQPGQTLPREADLMTQYGTSRSTVRQAIAELRDDGLVTPVRRRGTVVRRPPVRVPLSRYSRVLQPGGSRGPWETACADQGVAGRVDVMTVARIPATADVAARLGIAAGADVIYRQRHMYADDDLAQIHDVWMPAALVAGSPLEGDGKVIGGVLAAWVALGHTPAAVSEQVSARNPTGDEAAVMRLSATTPVLVIERVTQDSGGIVLELLRIVAASDQTRLIYDDLPIGAA
jgi:GntR family transcriptional regulator